MLSGATYGARSWSFDCRKAVDWLESRLGCFITSSMHSSVSLKRSKRSSHIRCNSLGTRWRSYTLTIFGSALANTISSMSIVTLKNVQFWYMSLSTAPCPLSIRDFSASPMPSQTGKWNRIWVQAKIHGMARRVSIEPAARRFAGRDPMFILPSSDTGVSVWKNSINLGSPRTTSRYDWHEILDISCMQFLHWSEGASTGASVASRTAPVYRSMVRKQISFSPNCCSITSPCTVTRSVPVIVLGGWESTAKWAGAPPRPTVPPRPWNRVRWTPNSFAALTSFSWTSYRPHAAANLPASFPLSE
mmetsp:Transcript_2748/g.8229  ORF Transcript_2748/g.8229 Transcript_2748/m.8229 type:complete len:303 (+) Transcript_2748:291-1199(+)